jgi:hypothetical protein
LPQIFAAGRRAVDVPVINQIYYPEPFFPPGTNNACGPIALFAGLSALKPDIQYNRLRDLAVGYGFNAEGITKQGLINTAIALNNEMGQPFTIEYGDRYRTTDLIKKLRQGAIIVILVRVKREAGQFRVTDDYYTSFGHFMLVDRINTRTKYVKAAGSTLGMDQIPLSDFIRAWAGENPPGNSLGWREFLKSESANNWALIIKRAR